MKIVTKFFVPGLGLVALALAALYGANYFLWRQSPEYQLAADLEKMEEAYANDPYGGETPEETLQLFIAALKQGDIELASKYFILDKQQEWLIDLERIKERGLLDEMVRDLEKTKLTINDNTAFFKLMNEDGFESQLVMYRNSLNKKWKITEL